MQKGFCFTDERRAMHVLSRNRVKLITACLVLLFLIVPYLFWDFLNLDTVMRYKVEIAEFIDNHYSLALGLFFLSCIIFINSPIPLAAIIKFFGGFFFGFYLGALYNILASILACLIGFSISRYAFKEPFEKKYYHRLRKIEQEVEKNGFYYFLTLRVIMVVPYYIINILAGISRLKFKHFLYSTCLGVIPASLVYANGGSKLEQMSSVSDIFRWDLLLAIVLILLLVFIPKWVKRISFH